ncbi:UDP-4-amino-4,6-dideoxy-N-acetyl-beta-L-altrosamine N-acetyltransferase [Crateriforma spongiae]|uniref:UDP-4-amino-4, 6-dideoxy-N-acetyl-beta-L-altrosamine N-acetyltransferase n=1 Tax=Crateriforma spongiae TaxID=2724528 RepID=UPI0039AFE93D
MTNARVSLVRVEADRHAHLLFQWRSQPDVARFMYSRQPLVWESHKRWVESLPTKSTRIDFIVRLDNKPVGSVYLTGIDRENERCEFGMYIADGGARVQGVGAAAEYLVLQHAFEALKLHKVSCEVFVGNASPLAMHKRFGFKTEGVLREHVKDDEGWIDVERLSLLVEQWRDSGPKMAKLLQRLIKTD